ncbi:MAG: MFS transporter [Chloroflexi bacterium]|nr:MFS transporter [Chloroflexota bacterium]
MLRQSRADAFGNKWYVLGVVCLGYLNAQWAMPPIAAILPSIGKDLGLTVPETGWIMTSYFLLLVGTVLPIGKVADRYGHKRVFATGVAIVTLASLLSGLSSTFAQLLASRALQGLGAAMIFATSLAIVTGAFRSTQRGIAVGMVTMISSLGALFGTFLSTWSVQHLSWHWGFFFVLPFGVAGIASGLLMNLPRPTSRARIDWLGGALLFAATFILMLGLNHLHDGPETFEAGAPFHTSMHLLALGFFVAFLLHERRVKSPLLSFKLLRDRHFSAGVTGNGIAHMSMLATSLLIPFLLERGRGLTPADTGLLLNAQTLSMTTCSLLAGWAYGRTRSPAIAVSTMGGLVVGLLTLGLFGGVLPYASMMGVTVLLGGSLGAFTTVNNTAVLTAASPEQRGFASGLVELTRQLGHGIGSSVSASLLGSTLIGLANPTYSDYVAGFQVAALVMGSIAVLGALIVAWPVVLRAPRVDRSQQPTGQAVASSVS